ncbi:MAG: hypothetical protein IPJ89_04845 [Candidatus Iainarchaeum archaeon]|uniref:Uncharacterized protein n=1 Tax=Candidatus Iainarchaeum sp. TaxID=3101447 RepID=A0A7T9I0Z6_9ARCH|nr:MAG: hypothetical protein IPJ89_04845 [Candidatus Diapherotrites archaeon]
MATRRPLQRTGKVAAFLGLMVLGACAGGNKGFRGAGPYERVAIQRDIRAAGNTFAPSPGSNPTQYAALGFTRTPDGKVRASPYFGHFETARDGKTFFNVQAAPNMNDPGAHYFAAGIGHTLFDGKVAVGTGFRQIGNETAQEFGAKLNLPSGTEITFSSELDEAYKDVLRTFRDNARVGVAQEIPIEIDGKRLFSGYFETGIHGEPKIKVGGSMNLGDFGALDAAFGLASKELQLRYSVPFGEKSEHFWFIGADINTEGGEPTFMIGINLTGYGRSRNPRRRKGQRGNTTGGSSPPKGGFRLVRVRADPQTATALTQMMKQPHLARRFLPIVRKRLAELRPRRKTEQAMTAKNTRVKWKGTKPVKKSRPFIHRPMRR